MKCFLFASLFLVGCSKALTPAAPSPEVSAGWESSGGDGVACFSNAVEAVAADAAGPVWPESLRQKIQSVMSLETFEHRELGVTAWAGMSREAILAKLMGRFEKYSPIFYSRLKLGNDSIHLTDWKDQANLTDVPDSRPKENVAKALPHCRLVQMAVRHSRSIPGKLPEVWIEVDKALFEKMDALNQAVLVLHEQMYLLGREIGHRNSDFLRGVVAELISDEFGAAIDNMPHFALSARLLQVRIGSAYGDYYRFFVEDPLTFLPETPPGYHPYSRYRSFGTLLALLRERKGGCLDEKDFDSQDEAGKKAIQEECSFFAVNPALVKDLLDEEQAFLFLARWVLDANGVIDTSENFVVWDRASPTQETPYQKAELERACRHLKGSHYAHFLPIVKQALSYCEAVTSPAP